MVITTEGNMIARMRLGVNEHEIIQDFKVREKAVTWIDLPESTDHSYEFHYTYYDQDGQAIDR